ncbi:hypothetical protein [Borreliella bavariensis]|nr:hypothetical protein [Borreliella bavariensis]
MIRKAKKRISTEFLKAKSTISKAASKKFLEKVKKANNNLGKKVLVMMKI